MHQVFYGEDKDGHISKVQWKDIMLITMHERVPVLTTSNGSQFNLITKFSQIKRLLEQHDFIKTDRGTLVNSNHIKEYDEEKRLLLLDNKKEIYATVSENRMSCFIDKI